MENIKTSVLIPSQLPEFIREEDNNFVLFLQAYYEWMEQNNNVLDHSKNLLNYKDIDKTTEQFLEYYINEFLSSFPTDAFVDKKTAIKAARELYKNKGTPSSYQFLFRILFNSDFDIFYTKDAVLKASAGEWYIARSLKLASNDPNFLTVNNLRIFGETTKSIATIENVISVDNKIEVFISDMKRLFQSGEFVRVVDSDNQTIYFSGQPLRAKILGQLSRVSINPNRRGLLYQKGDPVIIYGGLNNENGVGAIAEVDETTKGSLQRINVLSGGLGYTPDENTVITIANTNAIATVGSVDTDPRYTAEVTLLCNNVISLSRFVPIGNTYTFLASHPTSNANTALIDALTFTGFTTYPISSVIVQNSGSGISRIPSITATTTYETELDQVGDLGQLGILGPIQIISGGTGYQANDVIVISGGSGSGAYANVTNVNANGTITTVSYVYGPLLFPKGGMGYKNSSLPSLNIVSSNGANATLSVTGILGAGATFSPVVDRVGSISTIKLLNYGEDYVSTPNVSLKIQDIVVSNVFLSSLPQKGDVVYQGSDINVASYVATVNSISALSSETPVFGSSAANTIFNLRVFNYNSVPNTNLPLLIDKKDIRMRMANTAYNSNYNERGIRYYGDSTAQATASFLNGLVISDGVYLSDKGQLSGNDILQSEIYNNYTYLITVEKEISKYRETLLNLVHPAGTKLIGRFTIKSNSNMEMTAEQYGYYGRPLSYYTGYSGASATVTTSFTNPSNNIIQFNNVAGANIAGFITVENEVELRLDTGPYIKSLVTKIDYVSNTVTLKDNTWLTFANVATVIGNSNSNTINITTVTDAYDIVNNGEYSNTAYPLKDIVFAGDKILVANNTEKTVASVDYVGNKIYLTDNLTQNASSYLSVRRTYNTSNITIWGPVGFTYTPELITESGDLLITEDDQFIQVG